MNNKLQAVPTLEALCFSCRDDEEFSIHRRPMDAGIYIRGYKALGRPVIKCYCCGRWKRYEERDGGWHAVELH